MRIALMGTRGVPARYGGFETAVEEVGRRLVGRGHDVTVYCRKSGDDRARHPTVYEGMDLVHLPALRRRSLETLSHTTLSMAHQTIHGEQDVAVVFNAANSVLLPLLRLRRTPVATHVDGLEWRRGKWGLTGRRYYRLAESLAVRWSDALIADAQGIADYYWDEFGAETIQISYGAPILSNVGMDKLDPLGLVAGGYHLVVARFEPENHVDVAIEGYLSSQSSLPLVIVGSAPYASKHVSHIERLAQKDPRIQLLGAVWDQGQLDQLYAHACTYVHGHSVGGTNPSLLRAMGAGTAVIAYDVNFNRDVLGESGRFFANPQQLGRELDAAEGSSSEAYRLGESLRERAETVYDWDLVAGRYEQLCVDLANGRSQRGKHHGRRSRTSRWHP